MTSTDFGTDPTSTVGFIGRFEIDAAGIPFYKWPPWPAPPAHACVIPFSAFVCLGISSMHKERGEEVDGLGLPTVNLDVRHPRDTGGSEVGVNSIKKKRKFLPGAHGATPSWDDAWEAADQKTPVRVYNP